MPDGMKLKEAIRPAGNRDDPLKGENADRKKDQRNLHTLPVDLEAEVPQLAIKADLERNRQHRCSPHYDEEFRALDYLIILRPECKRL